jgi:hypothetical protein
MFGISPLGWVHTLGSLPAIPLATYMLARYGRIVPRSKAGAAYFVSMLTGALTTFLVAHEPVSTALGVITLVVLIAGYSVGRISIVGRAAGYLERVLLSITVFLLMVPAVSEVLRRVPDGHPFVTDLSSPLLLGAQAALFISLLAGVTLQIICLRRSTRYATASKGKASRHTSAD